MASSCTRFISRTAFSSFKSAIKSTTRSPSLDGFAASSSSKIPSAGKAASASPLPRFSSLSRSPSELGCAQSLFPLYSAVAAARLTSCLSSGAENCRALSQGPLVPAGTRSFQCLKEINMALRGPEILVDSFTAKARIISSKVKK